MIFSSNKNWLQKLRETLFPEAWRAILQRCVPLLACLAPEDRKELKGHIQVILAEKTLEGCAGQ